MTQTAIIDITTRVIKRLTTDSIPQYDTATELAVSLTSPIILSQFSVLGTDNVTVSPATQTQVQQAGLDDSYNTQQQQFNRQNLKTAIQNLQNDSTVPTTVKQAFIAFVKAFLS